MANFTYICYSDECNGREFTESRSDVAVCTSCGSNNIRLKSGNRRSLYLLPAIALLSIGGWFLLQQLDFDPIDDNPESECSLAAIAVSKIGNCRYQVDPTFRGSCQPDTLFWSINGMEQTPLLTSMGQFEAQGDITLHFALASASLSNPGQFQDTIINCDKDIWSDSQRQDERDRIKDIISAHLNDPFGPGKYEAFDITKRLEDGTIRLPDGRMTSGISWQNLLMLLWPNEQLKVGVEIDEYGDIAKIYFSK